MSVMRRCLLSCALLCVMALAACHRDKVPSGVMSYETMVAFTTEAYLIEGYSVGIVSHQRDTLSYVITEAYDSLYRKYNITPEIYDLSLDYYVHHPREMEAIQRDVLKQLKLESPLR